jgi:hypothetical protein
LAFIAGAVAAPQPAGAAAGRVRAGGPAPVLAATGPAVPGSYIVVLKGQPGTVDAARGASAASRAAALGVTLGRRYHHALNGFSAELSPAQADALRNDPDVAYLAPNQQVGLNTAQTPVTWGLDRIDQRTRTLDNIYDYGRTGAGVTAYVIDSGIRSTHVEFGGRVSGGFTAIADGRGTEDCLGHGTHVAGTVGSQSYGVAKAVRLVPVRVFGCSANAGLDAVLAGIEWVTANHSGPSVANMSLGDPLIPVLDLAVSNSIASGVTYVIASGNTNSDACTHSPMRVPEAITVGATDTRDDRIWFSNWGPCVDLFAPGVDIVSTGMASDTATRTDSGTSMASPHVAGAAALFLQANPTATPAQVSAWLTTNATPGLIYNPIGAPNLLLFANGPGTHTAMTWRVKEQRADGVVLVGSDQQTDPYQGDTSPSASLPILCRLDTGAPIPAGITPDQYNGWAGGSVALTAPVPGSALTSFTAASRICAGTFGPDWQMAEFHDGYYVIQRFPGRPPIVARSGWNLWAHGPVAADTRFWVSIDDQPGNAWN